MTFTTSLKEEISSNEYPLIEARCELEAFIKCNAKITNNYIIITTENAKVARKIYKDIKTVFNIMCNLTVRIQKRFRVRQIYILTINDNIKYIKEVLNITNKTLFLESNEEKIAFLEGAFLAVGNITNPSTSRYHLEYICKDEKIANIINNLLLHFKINSKIITRGYKFIVYIKNGDNISDILKMFKAPDSLFYFEDIRIYRDHKNMVNRLNNCEQANIEKSMKTSKEQIDNINYLKEKDLIDLLDDKIKMVILYKEKYPETTMSELAYIISMETGVNVSKSCINHYFRKIKELVNKSKNST